MLQGAGQPAPLRPHHGGEAPQFQVWLSPCKTLCLGLVLDGLDSCAELSRLRRGRSGSTQLTCRLPPHNWAPAPGYGLVATRKPLMLWERRCSLWYPKRFLAPPS